MTSALRLELSHSSPKHSSFLLRIEQAGCTIPAHLTMVSARMLLHSHGSAWTEGPSFTQVWELSEFILRRPLMSSLVLVHHLSIKLCSRLEACFLHPTK